MASGRCQLCDGHKWILDKDGYQITCTLCAGTGKEQKPEPFCKDIFK